MIYRVTALLAALIVAGCAATSGVQTYNERYHRSYSTQKVGFYAQQGGFKVAFLNTPAGVQDDDYKAAFTQAMTGHNFGPRIAFTAAKDLNNLPEAYALVLFEPGNIVPESLCKESSPQARPAAGSGSGEVLMIYCDTHRVMTTLRAKGNLGSPGSATFKDAVAKTTRILLGNPSFFQGGNHGVSGV